MTYLSKLIWLILNYSYSKKETPEYADYQVQES